MYNVTSLQSVENQKNIWSVLYIKYCTYNFGTMDQWINQITQDKQVVNIIGKAWQITIQYSQLVTR